MEDRRKNTYCKLTEDQGLFKSGTVSVRLNLTPMRRKNNRGDLICVGFMDNTEVEVIFPGRRRQNTPTLDETLRKLQSKRNEEAVRKNRALPLPINIRHAISASGTWRTRLIEKADDDVERRYQFLAAQWSFTDANGQKQNCGEAPTQR